MVTITKEGSNFIFEVKGIHKVLAFKSELTIPATHILDAHRDFEGDSWWIGWRVPGTYIPFLITAGTYYKDGEKNFWDVVNKEKSIVVELKDEQYNRLIIEVEDPVAAIDLLTGKWG